MLKYHFFSIYRPVSRDFFNLAKKRYSAKIKEKSIQKLYQYKNWPQEDSLCFSKKFPIFCVTDGVTLDPKREFGYPNPSGAYLVADIFAKQSVKKSSQLYDNFNLNSLKDIFKFGNQAVKKINDSHGRIKNKINYLDFDLFACTAANVILKDNYLYWSTIADAFVAVFDKQGKQKFCSPDGWRFMKMSKIFDENAKHIFIRRFLRNGFKNSKKIGYGVVTGEEKAIKYLDCGKIKLASEDLIVLGTDGYYEYLAESRFIEFIRNKNQRSLFLLEKELINKDPSKYGHERTLIAIKIL
ncbi:MAG TPA: protein phosphatase 2C domain-containing protein [bacterium]|nr:protein phosphatase 2C domain-containing protein [bacterium]HPL95478.1 protein phosphatase 2C domain-containing protein [bacterium]